MKTSNAAKTAGIVSNKDLQRKPKDNHHLRRHYQQGNSFKYEIEGSKEVITDWFIFYRGGTISHMGCFNLVAV